ncbi:YceD family protein [Guptibacillus algicola]|uniref:YceD family protein n=1 Tax=Guptibacillus algicola TaxID=225844 RepID=UPI001CD3B391|nr:YceD family protein [Alkalihalobacillus algicola]MCA0987962.1 YceD family protein [Alkalihalobacillus algicola]
MKWSVDQLKSFKQKGLTIDELVNVEELKNEETQIREITPVHVTGETSFHGNKVTFHLTLKGKMVLPCANTLEDVDFPFVLHPLETFVLEPNTSGVDFEEEDEEIHQVSGNTVDLVPYIKENILLEIPIRVVKHSSESDEMQNKSGKGWEVVTHEETEEKIDPRLAGLADLFNEKNDK